MARRAEYDVIIAGGGVAGCAAALALKKTADLKVCVIEKHLPSASDIHPSFDARVIALAKASIDSLGDLGINLGNVDACPITQIHVSDRHHIGQTVLDTKALGIEQFGSVVRLEQLGLSLYEQVKQVNIDYFSPDEVSEIEQTEDWINIDTKAHSMRAKLLVIAEGANSPTRELLNMPVETHDYGQSAIISNVKMQQKHEGQAFERFTKYGPVAFLPMHIKDDASSEYLMSVVWSAPSQSAQEIVQLQDEDFCRELLSLFGTRLGKIKSCSPRFCYPLSLKTAKDFVKHRVVCIGNAAQSLHPIAGQGFNTGIRDIADLVASIESAEIGDFKHLRNYKQKRQADKQAIVSATDGLVRVFSNHFLPFVIARNVGLHLLNKSMSLQSAFAKFAMGNR